MPRWHVSPPVDLLSYAFSWVWILVPLLLFGPDRHEDYLYLFMFSVIVIDLHRHYGLPYIYLDGQVTERFPLRFTLFPAVMFAGFAMTPYIKHWQVRADFTTVCALLGAVLFMAQLLRRDQSGEQVPWRHLLWATAPVIGGVSLALLSALGGLGGMPAPAMTFLIGIWIGALALDWCMLLAHSEDKGLFRPTFITPLILSAMVVVAVLYGEEISSRLPRGGLSMRNLISGIVVFAVAWNVWHVYMQKYGIMRLYNAKSGHEDKVPGWVDRLLVFAWVPLYLAWLGPQYKDLLRENFKKGVDILNPLLDLMTDIQPVALPLAAALVVGSLAIFVYYEHKVNKLSNRPRLCMALGTTLLSATFLVVDPVKAYIAYGFSHAIEYMVFVWAYQRRRYHEPLVHKPTLGRILRHPVVAYLGFLIVLGAAFFYLKYYGKYVFTDADRPRFLDFKTTTWFFYWTVYQSMVHFYFDGFLWKMRLPTTRAHI